MSLFTSDRERRLWLWVLAVMVAIYSSLGPARTLVDTLRERNLLRVAFWVVLVLVVGVVVAQWVKKRPGWSEVGVAFGVALAYWATFLRMQNPAERTHLIEYGIVAALLHQALQERTRNGRPVPMPGAITVAGIALLGLIDEGIQAVLPSRVFDWADVMFNALAGFMVVAARLAMAPVKQPGWRLWFLWLMAGAVGWGWVMDAGTFGEPRPIELMESMPPLNVSRYVSVAVGAAVVGAAHWLILRRYLTGSVRWVVASVAASAAGAAVVLLVGLVDTDTGLLAGVGLYGLLAGSLQWLVLRRQVPRAGWWVPANAFGWLVALPVGDAAGPPGWAVYGAITGTVLVGLLRQRRSGHVA